MIWTPEPPRRPECCKRLAKDRALMSFAGFEGVKAHEEAIQQIVRQGIAVTWVTPNGVT